MVRRWYSTRQPAWYVDHPNATAAAAKLLADINDAPLVPESEIPDTRDPPGLLTPRQREVLGGAAGGLTREQTADTLGISVESVRSHFKAAYKRLDAHNAAGAVAAAMRAGWL